MGLSGAGPRRGCDLQLADPAVARGRVARGRRQPGHEPAGEALLPQARPHTPALPAREGPPTAGPALQAPRSARMRADAPPGAAPPVGHGDTEDDRDLEVDGEDVWPLSALPELAPGSSFRLRPPRAYAAERPPAYFCCPLARLAGLPVAEQIMRDPVVAEDGFSYERQRWLAWCRDHCRSPVTHARRWSKELKAPTDRALAHAIGLWHARLAAAPGPCDSFYVHTPTRRTVPYVSPIIISDGDTYDLPQLRLLDGRQRSPGDHGTHLRPVELLVPHRAVAAMVADAGFVPCQLLDEARKYQMFVPPRRLYPDGALQAGCAGALAGGGIWATACMPLLHHTVGALVVPPVAVALGASAACGGFLGGCGAHVLLAASVHHADRSRRAAQADAPPRGARPA